MCFSSILTLGPSFQVDAQAKATLDIDVDLTVGINYKIDNAELIFPPNGKQASNKGAFNVGDTRTSFLVSKIEIDSYVTFLALKLSTSPDVNATGTLEAHLIPSLNVGLSALGGAVDATVFLNLDASATMKLGLEAKAVGVVAVDPKASAAAVGAEPAVRRESMRFTNRGYPIYIKRTELPNVEGITPTDAIAAIPATTSPESRAVSTDGSATFGGCVELDTGLDVNAGANGDFFGLFDTGTSVKLFSKKFELFKVRFQNSLLSICLLIITFRF